MNAVTLLEKTRALSIMLSPGDDGKLCYEARAGSLTPELRQALVVNKAAVLYILKAERQSARQIVQATTREHDVQNMTSDGPNVAEYDMPVGGSSTARMASEAAIADPLADFAAALRSGALQQCQACRHFTRTLPADGDNQGVPDAGWCRLYYTATHPTVPFWCHVYDPVTPHGAGW